MDDDLGKRIRHRKFTVHNQAWLQIVDEGYAEQVAYPDEQPCFEGDVSGPYRDSYGEGYDESDGEEDDMGMMEGDGDYSMDAYGETGFLNQQYYGDPDLDGL